MFLQFLNTRRTAAGFDVSVETSVKSSVPEPCPTKQVSGKRRSRREESSRDLDELLEEVIDEQEQEETLGKQKALRAQRRSIATGCSPGLRVEHSPVPVRRGRPKHCQVTLDEQDRSPKADHASTPATPSKLLSFITTRTAGAVTGRLKTSPKQANHEGPQLLQTPEQERQSGLAVTPKKQPPPALVRRPSMKFACSEQLDESSTQRIPGCTKLAEEHSMPSQEHRMSTTPASDEHTCLPVKSLAADAEEHAESKQDIRRVSRLDSGERASLPVDHVKGQPEFRGTASQTLLHSLLQQGDCARLREDQVKNLSKRRCTASDAVKQSTYQQEPLVVTQLDFGEKMNGLAINRSSVTDALEQRLPKQPGIATQLHPGDCVGLPDDQVSNLSRCRNAASDAVGRNISLQEPCLEIQMDSGDRTCLPDDEVTVPSAHRSTSSGATAPTQDRPSIRAQPENGDSVREPDVQAQGQPKRRSTALNVLQSLQVLSDTEECPLGPALEEPLQVSDDEEARPSRGVASEDLQSQLAIRRKQLHSQLFAKRRRQTVRGRWPQGSWPQPPPEVMKAEPLLSAKRELCIKRELGTSLASPTAASPEAAGLLKRRRQGHAPSAEEDEEEVDSKPSLQAEGLRSLHGLPREDLLQLAGQLERRFLYR